MSKAEYDRRWKAENRDKVLLYKKRYRQKHAARIVEGRRKWAQEHWFKEREYTLRYVAKKRSLAGGTYMTGEKIAARFAFFGNRCAYCGASGPLTVDHVIPIGKNGANLPANIRPACRSCNCSKQNSDYRTWSPRT